jgi:signal transduction histidine kinase
MTRKLRFPLRLRILVTLLLLVTTVVSLITFVMASVFHEDKQAYINDLTSIVALSTAEECSSLLEAYRDRLQIYGRIMNGTDLPRGRRQELLQEFFGDFPELVGLAVYEGGEEIASAFDANALEAAGMRQEEAERRLADSLPALEPVAAGRAEVRNFTPSESLPTFLMAVPAARAGDGSDAAIVALVRLDGLQELASRTGVFRVSIVDSRGVLLAHRDPTLPRRMARFEFPAAVERLGERHQAGMTVEYERDGNEILGGYAHCDPGDVVAVVEIPRAAAYLASRDVLSRLVLSALVLLLLGTVTSLIGSHRITRPIEELAAATREVAKGIFDIRVRVTSRDEIGTLANSFNQMAGELKEREEKLQSAQAQLIQSEKMAAFGQLGAGVAHEVKNPLAGILGCAQLSLRKAEEGSTLHRNLSLIEKETKRCKTIVENLLRFARQEKTIREEVDLNQVVEDSCSITRHQLELNQVKLVTKLDAELPRIRGNANQLQQVFINLVMNAEQAMQGAPGEVRVITESVRGSRARIRVQDDGPGIPLDIQDKIFEPFFTTKPGGKGTGLGLSVSYGIVTDLGGKITVESIPGVGTTFLLSFPALDSEAEAADSLREANVEPGPAARPAKAVRTPARGPAGSKDKVTGRE